MSARRKSPHEVLVAMLTRSAPLIDGPTGPFVRGWGGEIDRRTRDRLIADGLVRREPTMRHVLTLTEAGRNVALNAADKRTAA